MTGTLNLPSRSLSEQTYFSMTKGLCRVCRQAVDAKIVFRGEAVFLDKFCPRHGKEDVLVSSSVEWYLDALSFVAPASPPARTVTATTDAGCPFDCGPCASHQQRVFLPVIPITSACNMSCPVCYTVNRNADAYALSADSLSRLLDRLIEDGTGGDILNFTGGEPTLHPDLLGLLRRARDAGFRQLTISTNGRKLLDEALAKLLKQKPDKPHEELAAFVCPPMDDELKNLRTALQAAEDESKKRVVYLAHFNDVYHIQPMSKEEPIGGAARFSTVAEALDAEKNPLILFSGDFMGPSKESSLTRGRHMIECLNYLNVKFGVFGNHEFDFGMLTP